MIATVFDGFGDPTVLEPRDVPEPRVDAETVVVEVRAAAVNHLDLDIRAGTSRLPIRTPHQLGRESAGVVAAVGSEVRRWNVGDRVLVSAYPSCRACPACLTGAVNRCTTGIRPGIDVPGGYADLVAAPEHGVFSLPDAVGFDEAACLQLAFGTAWHALVTRAAVRVGETVVVVGAAGGTGSAATQIAQLAGAQVIAAVGSAAKADWLRGEGVEHIVEYGSQTLRAAVEELVGERAVDVVVDGVGGSMFTDGLALLRPDGRLVTYGAHGGETVPLDLIEFFRSSAAIVASRGWREAEVERLIVEVADGRLRAKVGVRVPLARAAEAHQLLERREVMGKAVLTTGDDRVTNTRPDTASAVGAPHPRQGATR